MNPGLAMILIPAFNEEQAIGAVIDEVRSVLPGWPIVVVDDGSADGTAVVARAQGAKVLQLPSHLGLGGAVQAGYKLAYELGFDYVIRIDGDGQHNPEDVPKVLEALQSSGCEMVIGSRFVEENGSRTTFARGVAIRFFRALLKPILGKAVTDPTSGFVGVNRRALALFSKSFPLEYPEIEALVVLQRRRFTFLEVPCRMRPRLAGRSTITSMVSVRYIIHVLLGVFVNVLRIDSLSRWVNLLRGRKDTQ